MLTSITLKIRSLVEDFLTNTQEVFTYTISPTFTLLGCNIYSVVTVLKNGVILGSAKWDYDETTKKLTITDTLANGDIIEVDYTYYKYSDTEITGYIRSALVWMSVFGYTSADDYELEDDDIYPTPDNRTCDTIALVASILIRPDFTEYKLPNVIVKYSNKKSKEEKVEALISKIMYSLGVNEILEWDDLTAMNRIIIQG